MTQHTMRRLRTIAIWTVIFVAGLLVGWFSYRARQADEFEQRMADTQRSAVVLDPAEIATLSGTRADVATPAYQRTKDRLRKLAAVDASIREARLYRYVPETGLAVQLGDSTASGARGEALPGDSFAPGGPVSGLQHTLRTGAPATDGPFQDDTGRWLVGYAFVGEVPSTLPDRPAKDILAITFGLEHWARDLVIAAAQGAIYTWVLLGLPLGALLVFRRQYEQREVIRNLSEAMEQSHSAIAILDLAGRVEYVNRGLCRQMGFSRRELIGRDWRDFRGAQTPESIMTDLFAVVHSGHTWEGEWFNGRKDGTSYAVRGAVTPVKHRDNSLSCFVAVFDDVTETKRREAELREARDLAEAGDRAKGQFLATMSHEVRTPLNGIVGFTSLLLDTTLSGEQREYVQTIRSSGEALIQLTGDILDYARIDSGKLKLDLLACDPRDCIEEALDLLAAKAAEKNLELLHRCAADVPSAVLADGGRLRQVLVNLIGNAVKFTEHGEIEVSVKTVRREASAATETNSGGTVTVAPETCVLEFSVRDSGIGISPEQHARLFRPFSQLDDSTTRRYGGTGLGLAISRNLVQLMGGNITVASQPAKGSVFTFTIQAAVAAIEPPTRNLENLPVAVALRPGSLRRELVDLLSTWNARTSAVDKPEELATVECKAGLVGVDEELARELAERAGPLPGLAPEKMVGLVPISLSSELRSALRMHFRLLVNKPVHHAALFGLLSGSRTAAPFGASAPTRFGFRVLVVEDNRMNQRLMERVLTSLGCAYSLVENGRLAVEELTVRADNYDLVVLDLHMPEMDGMEALEQIRRGVAGPRAQTLWIIALTADAREQERARGMAAGLNDYLTKPLRILEFEAALRRFRNERAARRR